MPNISASNSITAKVRAKFGARLTEQNYNDMLSLSTVSEVASYLKTRTRYSSALTGLKESAVHRGNLERLLYEYYLTEMSQLCRFERSVGDKMAEVVMRREEVRVILEFLRYLASGHPEDYLLVGSDVSNSVVSFDVGELSRCRTLAQLAEAVKPSFYSKVIAGFAGQKDGKIDYTMIEATLNKALFSFEQEFVSKEFTGIAQKELLGIIGMRADMDNVCLCFRAKKYYNTPSELIMSQLIDFGTYISKSVRLKMAQAESSGEVTELFRSTRYGEDVKEYGDMAIDAMTDRIMNRKLTGSIRMSTSPAVVSVCYTGLILTEIKNIVTVIEGVRYNEPPESIKSLIITE